MEDQRQNRVSEIATTIRYFLQQNYTTLTLGTGGILYGLCDHTGTPLRYTLHRDTALLHASFFCQQPVICRRYRLLEPMTLLNTSWLLYMLGTAGTSTMLSSFCPPELQYLTLYATKEDDMMYQRCILSLRQQLGVDESFIHQVIQAELGCAGYITDRWIYPLQTERRLDRFLLTMECLLETDDNKLQNFQPATLEETFPSTCTYKHSASPAWGSHALFDYVCAVLQVPFPPG